MTKKTPNLHGSGKQGYRLWIRSLYDTWVEVPYGAGQDNTIRSLNIWDAKAKKWRVPANGWSVRLRENDETDRNIDSLNFYAPGRSWIGGETQDQLLPFCNPNYSTRRFADIPFAFMSPNWIRLFHLMDRPDPNWRIVPLGVLVPNVVPNRTINWNTGAQRDTSLFWPNNSSFSVTTNRAFDGTTTTTNSASGGNNATLRIMGSVDARYSSLDIRNPDFTTYSHTVSTSAGMVDLRAIRQRLIDEFPQQQIDYVGQYNDISTMAVKRVIIHGTVSMQFTAGGVSPTNPFTGAVATITASTSIPSAPTTWTVGGKTYPVRSPGSVTGGEATIYQKAISDLVFAQLGTPDPSGVIYTAFASETATVTYTWENPGEDSVGCYARIDGLPPAPNGSNWTAAMNFTPSRIAIHYASAGHDVPTAKRVWDVIT